jgi:hypothetical protein
MFKRVSSYTFAVCAVLSLAGAASAQSPADTPEALIEASEKGLSRVAEKFAAQVAKKAADADAAKRPADMPEALIEASERDVARLADEFAAQVAKKAADADAAKRPADTPEALIEASERDVARLASKAADGTGKLVGLARAMEGRKLALKVPDRGGMISDPADMLAAINAMIGEVYDIEQQYRRGAITIVQRDFRQGKAVARAVGSYGGGVAGTFGGAALGELVAGPAGAAVGGAAGGHAGSAAGDDGMRRVADSFEAETRLVARTFHNVFDKTGEAISSGWNGLCRSVGW